MNRDIYPRGYKRLLAEPVAKTNSYFPKSDLSAVGRDYERFVAGYCESKFKNSIVVHQGAILGKKDSGIDLVVITENNTYLVQCKRYKAGSLIRSNTVSQLYGDTNAFRHKFPEAKNVVPMLVATCAFSDDAQEYALIDSIGLLHLPYKPPFHANGPCYLDKADSDYASFLKSLINAKQHPVPIEVKQAADRNIPSVNQTPEKPEQPAPLANQILKKPEKTVPSADQNNPIHSAQDQPRKIGLLSLVAALGVCIVYLLVRPSQPQAITVTATPSPIITVAPTATPQPTEKVKARAIPENGTVQYNNSLLYLLDESQLTVNTPKGYNYCIILVDPEKPSTRSCSIFVKEDSAITVDVPAAEFLLYYTAAPASAEWYGFGNGSYRHFGEKGAWTTSDEVFDFEQYTYTLTLYPVENGDWNTEDIPQSQVPFLE